MLRLFSGVYWRVLKVLIILNLAMWIVLGGMTLAQASSKEEKQGAVRKMAQETLAKFYTLHPKAKDVVDNSEGFAA